MAFRPLQGKFTYPGYTDPVTGGVLTCCTQDIGNYFGNNANSSYNALQALLEKRFYATVCSSSRTSPGPTLWAMVATNGTGNAYFANVPRIAYGNYDQNRPLVWVFKWCLRACRSVRAKQFASNARGALNCIIGGWQLTNTTNWSSGLPWTPTLSNCGSEVNSESPCRPDVGLGQFNIGTQGFDPVNHVVRYFTPTTVGGNMARSWCRTDRQRSALIRCTGRGFSPTTCGIAKNFQLTERFGSSSGWTRSTSSIIRP